MVSRCFIRVAVLVSSLPGSWTPQPSIVINSPRPAYLSGFILLPRWSLSAPAHANALGTARQIHREETSTQSEDSLGSFHYSCFKNLLNAFGTGKFTQ